VARGPRPRPGRQHPRAAAAAPAARPDKQADRPRAARWSARRLTPAALLGLLALLGCSTDPAAPDPAAPNLARPADGPPPTAPPAVIPTSAGAAGLGSPAEVCASFATAAATITTATGTLGQSRQAAARRYGTPGLQALYDGSGKGRDRQQELWQQHQAQAIAQAQPVAADLHHEYDQPGGDHQHDERQAPGQRVEHAAVIVIVTGTARGDGGWTAPVQPHLLLPDPVRGWLVDDLVTDPMPAPAAAPAPAGR
jgi:hypothetical protein